jgi:GNAT superfamily N-acetyltransferase
MQPVYRDIRDGDADEMAEVLSLTCNPRGYTLDDTRKREVFGIYLAGLLARTTYACVAEVDGRIAGYILGGVVGDEPVDGCDRGSAVRGPGATCPDDALWMVRDLRAILEADERMLTMCAECGFDSELLMYILRPELKGRGIGRRLLTGFLDHLRERGCSRMFLFTDWFSDAHAFMHMGYVQTAFAMVEQGPGNRSYPFYIFSREL